MRGTLVYNRPNKYFELSKAPTRALVVSVIIWGPIFWISGHLFTVIDFFGGAEDDLWF
jgi:hypothetical protein